MFNETGWILKRATLSLNKIALVDVHTKISWTYTTLKNRVLQWVAYFSTEGYSKGERIAIIAPNSPELFAVLFACELKELIYVPINWRLSAFEISTLLQDCKPSELLYNVNYKDLVLDLGVNKATSLESVGTLNFDVLDVGNKKVNTGKPWMMIYTGGTTGKPKGVVLSTDAVNSNALNTIATWGITETDTTINYMPLFHTGGINALAIPVLMAGGKVVIGNQFDAEEAMRATDEYNATISLFVPTMYQSMIKHPYFHESKFLSMKAFLSGGAPCPTTIYKEFYKKGHPFKEGYGLTEAGPNNFFIRPEESYKKMGSVGKAMLLNSVKVVDTNGDLCEVNKIGELYITGPHVFSYYWDNEKVTAEALENGWLRTGDLAKYDEDGDYFIVGRKKEIIITGGENVYPQEVEQCLSNFESINEVAVIAKKDERWGEIVIAFITKVEGASFNCSEAFVHCEKFLGKYKIPKEIIVIPEMPKTHVGKIDKKALQSYL
ncbi:AMP-binding protein [Sporosarcina sp. CAU 1771]